jgi:hypothetical protein
MRTFFLDLADIDAITRISPGRPGRPIIQCELTVAQ